jgi:hypothetical protein
VVFWTQTFPHFSIVFTSVNSSSEFPLFCVQVFPLLVHLEKNKRQFVKLFLHYLCEFYIHFVCEKIYLSRFCLHLCKFFFQSFNLGENYFPKVYLH